jgi:hypothetical protein
MTEKKKDSGHANFKVVDAAVSTVSSPQAHLLLMIELSSPCYHAATTLLHCCFRASGYTRVLTIMCTRALFIPLRVVLQVSLRIRPLSAEEEASSEQACVVRSSDKVSLATRHRRITAGTITSDIFDVLRAACFARHGCVRALFIFAVHTRTHVAAHVNAPRHEPHSTSLRHLQSSCSDP